MKVLESVVEAKEFATCVVAVRKAKMVLEQSSSVEYGKVEKNWADLNDVRRAERVDEVR